MLAALVAGALAAACATTEPELAPIDPRGTDFGLRVPDQDDLARSGRDRRRGPPLTPPHLTDRADQLVRVALLLPFTSTRSAARVEADGLFKAAQLALFERGHQNLLLIPKDTGGTAAGARAAAEAALDEGADVIIGPLFASGVEAAASVVDVARTPIIAFSNDRAAAGQGAFLLGLAPEDEVARLVEYALRQGLTRFAALAPDNAYGQRVRDSLNLTAQQYGGALSRYELFPPTADAEALTRPARALARYDARVAYNRDRGDAPPPPQPEPEPRVFVAADGAVRTTYVRPQVGFDVGYDAILLPAGGVRLLTMAPLMPYYDVDPRRIRFLGTSLWRDERVLDEPSLQGGWFVDTDPAPRSQFEASYRRAYRADPSRRASLAYDAVTLVAFLTNPSQPQGLSRNAIARADGFYGVDGIFRFREDGAVERGLAVFQIRDGEFRILEPAPRTFDEAAALPRPAVFQPNATPATTPASIPRPPGFGGATSSTPSGSSIPRPPGASGDGAIPRPSY